MKSDKGQGWGWAARATWLALAACGSHYAQPYVAPPDAGGALCSSGSLWNPNLQAGEDMAPGRACVACHAEENAASGELDAPMFAVAGTLYPSLHEPDDCRAPASRAAVVRVRSARGLVRQASANEVGNFFIDEEDGFTPPFTIEVEHQGRTRRMLTPAPSGDCGTCHTEVGESGAPGRVALP